jgi:hypothetical protein
MRTSLRLLVLIGSALILSFGPLRPTGTVAVPARHGAGPNITGPSAGANVARNRIGPNIPISRDPLSGSKAGTEVDPDIAVNPTDGNDLVGAFQEGRLPSIGGDVDNGFATSTDGGQTWITGSLPGLTQAVGGPYECASDPAVAFGLRNMVYASLPTE